MPVVAIAARLASSGSSSCNSTGGIRCFACARACVRACKEILVVELVSVDLSRSLPWTSTGITRLALHVSCMPSNLHNSLILSMHNSELLYAAFRTAAACRFFHACMHHPSFFYNVRGTSERRNLRSRRIASEQFLLMKVVATPVLPHRPVRPIRCTYVSISLGMSKLITCCTSGKSRPFAATSGVAAGARNTGGCGYADRRGWS